MKLARFKLMPIPTALFSFAPHMPAEGREQGGAGMGFDKTRCGVL